VYTVALAYYRVRIEGISVVQGVCNSGNPGNLLEFQIAPGNTGNLQEFS